MKFNGLLLFPIALLIIIAITVKPKISPPEWQASISQAALIDSLPISFLKQVNPQTIQGYRINKGPYEDIFYYEYTANHAQVLKAISSLPFAADSLRADVQCRMVLDEKELKHIQDLLQEQTIASVFKSSTIEHYTIYECLKTPQHHFVLLDNSSG